MAQLFRLPVLGQTMEEGTIVRWLKKEGDPVKEGEPLVIIATDKADIEVESPVSGVVRQLLYPEDAMLPVQTPICILGDVDDDISALLAEAGGSSTTTAETEPAQSDLPSEAISEVADIATRSAAERPMSTPRARNLADEHGLNLDELELIGTGPYGWIQEHDVMAYIKEAKEKQVRITPLARRIAEEAGFAPEELVGSGSGGKIRSDDVLRAIESTSPVEPLIAKPVPSLEPIIPVQESQRVPLTRLRKRIADNISDSARTAPHVTMTMETDMTELVQLRTQLLSDVEAQYGARITYTDFIIKATALTLRKHPWLNSSFDGDAILLYREVHMGVAVAVPEGLVVPVVRNVEQKSLAMISIEVKELAKRARQGKLIPDEMVGGTFTLTNLGGYGVDAFTPIINPPQSAILGVGRIVKRPAFGPDGEVVARSQMNLCLSFDHRVVDGAPAAEFLRDLRDMLENPLRILI